MPSLFEPSRSAGMEVSVKIFLRKIQHHSMVSGSTTRRKTFFLSILLTVSILLSSCSNSLSFLSEKFGNASGYQSSSSSQILEKENFMLLLLSCISNLSEIQNVYASIPRSQLDGISLSSFDAYIRALNDMMPGKVERFRFLSNGEKAEVLNPISEGVPDQELLINSSIPVELQFQNSEIVRYIYIQSKENGTVFISNEWITGCILMYQYATLYFQAIDKKNQNAVESLLENSIVPETDGKISSLVIDYKAKGLLDYYQRQVRDQFDQYQMESIDLLQLTYIQPRFLDEETGEYVPRRVRFIRRTSKLISVKDTVTSPLNPRDIELYKKESGNLHITVGERIDMDSLDFLMGEKPLIISSELEPSLDGMKTMVVGYHSLTITLQGLTDTQGNLINARIIRMRLHSGNDMYSFGPGIKIGMEMDTLLRLYPFADLEDYKLKFSRNGQEYRMILTVDTADGGHITSINVEVAQAEE